MSSEGIHGVYLFLNSYLSICIEGNAHTRDLVNGGDISPMIDGVSNFFISYFSMSEDICSTIDGVSLFLNSYLSLG